MFNKKNSKKSSESLNQSRYILANAPIQPALKFRIEESYKAIRTNIMFSIMKKGCKTIVISSSNPNEGKTTTTVNLAISIAQADHRVLLIDADLRKPKVHHYFSVANSPGLTNYLGDSISMKKKADLFSVIHPTDYENLSILCSGSIPPNPAELLSSELMSDFLDEISSKYDYIIIDTPPINVVSDALPLIREADGVVLVVRQNQTTHPDLQKALSSLDFIDAKLLGFVVNFVESKAGRRYTYKGYGYSNYGYGYGYGYGGYGSYGNYNSKPNVSTFNSYKNDPRN